MNYFLAGERGGRRGGRRGGAAFGAVFCFKGVLVLVTVFVILPDGELFVFIPILYPPPTVPGGLFTFTFLPLRS